MKAQTELYFPEEIRLYGQLQAYTFMWEALHNASFSPYVYRALNAFYPDALKTDGGMAYATLTALSLPANSAERSAIRQEYSNDDLHPDVNAKLLISNLPEMGLQVEITAWERAGRPANDSHFKDILGTGKYTLEEFEAQLKEKGVSEEVINNRYKYIKAYNPDLWMVLNTALGIVNEDEGYISMVALSHKFNVIEEGLEGTVTRMEEKQVEIDGAGVCESGYSREFFPDTHPIDSYDSRFGQGSGSKGWYRSRYNRKVIAKGVEEEKRELKARKRWGK